MKTSLHVLILSLLLIVFSNELIGQNICDQYLATMKNLNQESQKKRSFRMTSQINGDKNINYTESDTLGRIHFWGNVGSLKIESYFADGKRYSKIQSSYITDDEWTYQDVNTTGTNTNKSLDPLKSNTQVADCQFIGEEKIKSKNCKILTFTILKNMPKRNGIDSFLMEMTAKTWYCAEDSLVYKYEFNMSTERLSQTIKSTIEYDVPVKINIPKNAKYQEPQKIMVTQQTQDTLKSQPTSSTTIATTVTDSNQTKANIAVKENNTTKDIVSIPDSSSTKDSSQVYTNLDQIPEYAEGMPALFKYISSNINYPQEARKAGASGTVYVGFIVETDGRLTNVHIKRGVREDIDSEAKRIVESMSGTWKPGKINGKDVRSAYTLPLKFELHE